MKIRTISVKALAFLALMGGLSGCGLFSNKAGDAELVFGATEVGTPEGQKIAKDIGPAGGTLTSPDGRMTLTVPPGALTETITFSMQPITNKAGGGLGLAYRLEPDGATFTTPLEVSVRYDSRDIEDTIPEALSLAYQDARGAWHEFRPLKLTEGALTVAATHFTDFAILKKLRISPAKATIRVGETINVELIGCVPVEETWLEKTFGKGKQYRKDGSSWDGCYLGSELQQISYDWNVDVGTLGPNRNPVTYTAPSKKPSPNVATVAFPYYTYAQRTWSGESRKGLLLAHITIIDRGYRASGQDGVTSYSGVICDLEKPFEVTGTHPLFTFPFKFTPSSPTGGTMSYEAHWAVVRTYGSVPYTIQGADTDSPKIVMQAPITAEAPHVKPVSGAGLATILLTPLDGNECSSQ